MTGIRIDIYAYLVLKFCFCSFSRLPAVAAARTGRGAPRARYERGQGTSSESSSKCWEQREDTLQNYIRGKGLIFSATASLNYFIYLFRFGEAKEAKEALFLLVKG